MPCCAKLPRGVPKCPVLCRDAMLLHRDVRHLTEGIPCDILSYCDQEDLLHLHLEPGYPGDMELTLNHSTNGKVSRLYVVGFEPTHGCLPDPTTTTSLSTV
ncbi:hypothetical protein E2C01_073754 [Portunus trituberculatus]|uniref:Uncharacterized protein n=1 Tax=Portunus trituberculatus TaxID=210409 RepID=A0A5B7IEC9_PORTR|nr:hypothetical protein [Portunus trituberculatus]